VSERVLLQPLAAVPVPDSASMRELDADILLRNACWPDGARTCPRCLAGSPYTLSSGRYRCGICGYTFSDYTGRWLARTLLTPLQWLRVVRQFIAGASPLLIAGEVRAAPNTVRRALRVIGTAICSTAPDAAAIAEVAPSLVEGQAKTHQADQPWFVIGLKGNACTILPDITPERFADGLLGRWGDVLYSNPRDDHDALVALAPHMIANGIIARIGRAELPVDVHSSLWRLAKERAGAPPRQSVHLLRLMKECEFLLDGADAEQRLLRLLCSFVPRQSAAGVTG
jgi:transposase